MSKSIEPEMWVAAVNNRTEIETITNEICDEAINKLVKGKKRKREQENLVHIRLEIYTALTDLDDLYRVLASPADKVMLSSVAFRLLALGTQLGRFAEPLAFVKALQANRAAAVKEERDGMNRSALDEVIASICDESTPSSRLGAKKLRPKVLKALNLPEDLSESDSPKIETIRKAVMRFKRNRKRNLSAKRVLTAVRTQSDRSD